MVIKNTFANLYIFEGKLLVQLINPYHYQRDVKYLGARKYQRIGEWRMFFVKHV